MFGDESPFRLCSPAAVLGIVFLVFKFTYFLFWRKTRFSRIKTLIDVLKWFLGDF